MVLGEKLNFDKGKSQGYYNLGVIYKNIGKYKTAEVYLKHSMQLNKQIGDKLYLSDNYISLGQIYAETGKYYQAVELLKKGLEISKESGLKTSVEEAYRTLYKIYKKQKRYKQALFNLEMAKMYHDSVMNIALNKDIARLQMQFETERKENQIVLLEQQAKIRELNLKKQKFLNYFLMAAFFTALIIVVFLLVYLLNKNKLTKILMDKNRQIEKAKLELEKREKELENAKSQAEASSRSKSEFLANMSHEIRTPLNSVIGFSDILATLVTDEKQQQYISAIKSSGKSLLALINDILDLSKIEANKLDVVLEPVNIENVLDSLHNMFLIQAKNKGLDFNIFIFQTCKQTF